MKIHRVYRVVSCLALVAITGPATEPAGAHDIHLSPAEARRQINEHWRVDFGFAGFDALNSKLQRDFDNFREPTTVEIFRALAPPEAGPDAHLIGAWSEVFDAPVVPIHTTLLVDGRVLFWDSVSDLPAEQTPTHTTTRAAIWNPATGSMIRVDNTATGYNIFCAGYAHLPDGRVLVAGGNLNPALQGTRTLHIFDHATDQWALSPLEMIGPRWYPSTTPLGNGETLIMAGGTPTPEVFGTDETLRTLSAATLGTPAYPWLQAATNGDAFYFGPDNNLRYLDTRGVGVWRPVSVRDGFNRNYGSFAMFDVGKVLANGGGASLRSSVVIDFTNPNANPMVQATADMASGRRQHNLTALPDGSVLATGGNSSGAPYIDKKAAVYQAELWSPSTGTWTLLSSAARTRQYHSTAMLLPDGRVFTGGGGICAHCQSAGYLEKNYEIYSPPYLFRKDGSGELADRPAILAAPTQVAYSQIFFVATPAPDAIRQLVMMRVASVTHSVDFEQRRVPLRYTVVGGRLRAVAPVNSNVAPPGYYMLFLIDAEGVPSVSSIVKVVHAGLGAPMIVAATAYSNSAVLTWIPVHGATSYLVRRGTVSGDYRTSFNVGDVASALLTGLTPGTRYYFAISARTTIGGPNSAEVAIDTTTTPFPPGPGTGLTGDYYSGTGLANLVTTRLDPQLNFAWGDTSPASGVSNNFYSVRWTGFVQAPATGLYTFYTTSDDGVRLWVSGQTLVHNWTPHGVTVNSGTIAMVAGYRYPVTMEFFENSGVATAKLEWSGPGVARAIVPTTRLYPVGSPSGTSHRIS